MYKGEERRRRGSAEDKRQGTEKARKMGEPGRTSVIGKRMKKTTEG